MLFKDKHQINPIDLILPQMSVFEEVDISFPVLMRIGENQTNIIE